MRKGRINTIVTAVLLAMILPVFLASAPVLADTGPKPSVQVQINGLGDDSCYATLLSAADSTGPASSFSGSDPEKQTDHADYETWLRFVRFQDADGYYYLQQHWTVSAADSSFTWGYYPPDPFKVLLFFPKYDSFVVTESTEKYAFDSSYSVDLTGVDFRTSGSTSVAPIAENQDTGSTVVDIAIRIVLTLVIELGIALLFGYRERNLIIFIAAVNLVTQILMNAVLFSVQNAAGHIFTVLFYVLLEIGVFILEGILYFAFLPPLSHKPIRRGFTLLYALVANVVSCVAGFVLVLFQL